jgi:hypothetical protein
MFFAIVCDAIDSLSEAPTQDGMVLPIARHEDRLGPAHRSSPHREVESTWMYNQLVG